MCSLYLLKLFAKHPSHWFQDSGTLAFRILLRYLAILGDLISFRSSAVIIEIPSGILFKVILSVSVCLMERISIVSQDHVKRSICFFVYTSYGFGCITASA